MLENIVYFVSLLFFFGINLRIIRALHFESKFEKYKLWEIKAAIFITAIGFAHLLAEIVLRLAGIFDFFN